MPPKYSEAKPAQKLLALYTLLLFNPGRQFSLSNLAEKLECSKQTVVRLIDQIEAAEYSNIIQSKLKRESFYAIKPPRYLPKMTLNAEGLFQLALCRNLLFHLLPKDMRKQADKTLREAASYTQDPVSPDTVTIGQAYTKGSIDYSQYQSSLNILIQAIHSHRVCTVSYQRALNREPREFEFAPMQIIAYHETLSLFGWEVTEIGKAQAKYEKPASLYLHRLKDVVLTRRTAEHLPMPTPAQDAHDGGSFGIVLGESFRVRIHFVPQAALYVYERQWSTRQDITVHEDGSVILDFEAQSRKEVLAWLLSFGNQATVLEPDWLRQAVKEQATDIAGKY